MRVRVRASGSLAVGGLSLRVVVGGMVSFEMNDRKSKRPLAHPLGFLSLSPATCEAVWYCVFVRWCLHLRVLFASVSVF